MNGERVGVEGYARIPMHLDEAGGRFLGGRKWVRF